MAFAASTKRLIADALVAKIQSLVDSGNQKIYNYVAFNEIKLKLDQFKEHELPALQMVDQGCSIKHLQSQIEKTWTIAIEIVLKSDKFGTIDQRDLWDHEIILERAIGESAGFGIPRVRHLRYLGNQSDLHFIGPYYSATLIFEALFTDPYTRDC